MRALERNLLSCAALALVAFGARAQEPVEGDEVTPRGFAIPETRQARVLASRASDHIAAERYVEAIADLQSLITEHRGAVLRRDLAAAAPANDGESSYRGAADWAREQIYALPAPGRERYRERYGNEAATALALARRGNDRGALIEIAQRYPLCDAARDAWWTLGDWELELGNREAAITAWRRAAEFLERLGQSQSSGARTRLEQLAVLTPQPIAKPASLPGADCPSWRKRIDDNPRSITRDTPFGGSPAVDPYVLQATLAGDTLLVCDTLRVRAFDAWSGAVRWITSEPPGWDQVDAGKVRPSGAPEALDRKDFFAGVDLESLIARPAASAGVVVAALQVPVTHNYNRAFQHFQITTVIPERRLFAYDLTSGRELWNHLPPPLWDGEGGAFQERMSVAAPPVIAGSRVIVPAYRMQGRVDLHVACFDLFSGRLLWSTALISGQLELNMFGRQSREFAASPVTVAGERVLIATQLGAVAALDLATGDILWETLYEQLGIPASERHFQREREQFWNNTAPLHVEAAGGAVAIVTPIDAHTMLAYDVERGTPLWSIEARKLVRSLRQEQNLTLLDADADTIWVAGVKVISARSPRGLRDSAGPIEINDSLDLSESRPMPRAAATADHIVVASHWGRIALDRNALRRQERAATAEWEGEQSLGNVLAAEGALFMVSRRYVTACVDFPAVEKRYRERLRLDPGDPRAALDYADLVRGRAESLLGGAGQGAREAATLLAEARPLIERLAPSNSELTRALFAHLMLEARAANAAADTATATAALERARTLAPDDESRVLVLFALHAQAVVAGDAARRARFLDELDACCAGLAMPAEWWTRSGRASFASDARDADVTPPISAGQWVATERLHEAASRGDYAAELELAHQLLARYDDPLIPARPGSRDAAVQASTLIQTRLDGGARDLYEPFEQRARELLARARSEDSQALFEQLAHDFPHSLAAREALDAELRAALVRGETRTVANIALRRIPDDWAVELARPEQVEGLVAMATALERAGNRELARELLRSLARKHADSLSPFDGDGGSTLAQLAERAALGVPPERGPTATFNASPARAVSLPGRFHVLGQRVFEVAGAPEELLVLARRDAELNAVIAFSASGAEQRRWETLLAADGSREPLRSVCTERTVVVAERSRVTALEAERGTVAWHFDAGDERVEELMASSGVAVLVLRASDGGARLLAIDATTGLELWTRATPRELWARPVLGPRSLALLPADYASSPARVLDLFTGSRVLEFVVEGHVGDSDLRGAWIRGGTLVLPSFPKSSGGEPQDCVLGFDLDTGRRLWHVAGDEQRVFDSIVRRGDDTYLVFLGGAGAGRSGFVLELELRAGAVRKLQNVAIGENDVLVGVPRHRVVEFDGPYLLVRSSAPGEAETLLRGIHLPYGERWVHRMPIAASQFVNQGLMPEPRVSESTLALAYTASARLNASNTADQTGLIYFNRDNGLLRGERGLDRNLGRADDIELAALGSSLFVVGRDALVIQMQ